MGGKQNMGCFSPRHVVNYNLKEIFAKKYADSNNIGKYIRSGHCLVSEIFSRLMGPHEIRIIGFIK